MVDKDGDKAISIAELTTHLNKISFSEPMNFLSDLKKKDEEFKTLNPQYAEEFMKAVSLFPRTSNNQHAITPGGDTPDGSGTPGGSDSQAEPYDASIYHENQRYLYK